MARTRGSTIAHRSLVERRCYSGRDWPTHAHTQVRAPVMSHTWRLARLPPPLLTHSLSLSLFFPFSLSIRTRRRCRARAQYPFFRVDGLCTGRIYRNVTREDSLSSARFYDDNWTGTASRTRENPLLIPWVGKNDGIEPCGLSLDLQLSRVQRTNRRDAVRVRTLIRLYKGLICIAPLQY